MADGLPPDIAAETGTGAAWVACMRSQNFCGAWAIGDAILARRNPATRDAPGQPYHLRWVWDGTPPDGLQVLVRCFHGLGDTLQFARFLPLLRARAAHVTLEAQPELCPLLAGLPGVDSLVPFDLAVPLPPSDCDIEIMELAHVLRADAAQVAACVPYIFGVQPARLAGASNKPGDTIGLCWEAGGWDSARSVPLKELAGACSRPGRRFVSLQRGPSAGEAAGPGFVNPGDADMSLVRTAALAAACSAIVSVDSMVAHLAGALGTPVFLLAKHDPDWRWPHPGQPCPWYPTMTVLHQHRPGEWAGALAELRQRTGLSSVADRGHS